jgi:transposase
MIGSAREHEGRKLIPLMESISIGHGPGRSRKRPETVYADTKYGLPLNRFWLDARHVRQQIPESSLKKRGVGRPRAFDKDEYHGVRYNVERFFGWLENYRKLAVRYERLPNVFLGLIRLACSMILWRVLK